MLDGQETALAQFKGTVFVSTRKFTEHRFGPDAVERVLTALSAEHQTQLRQITAVGWYPVEPVLAYHHALDKLYGQGDLSLCVEVGRYSAGWALNTILKFVLRFKTPHWMVEKWSTVWQHYHDSGQWDVDPPTSEKRLCGRLINFEVNDAAFCARLRGWVAGAIELTGGKNPQVTELRCATKGHPLHEFRGTWE